jgi:integrase
MRRSELSNLKITDLDLLDINNAAIRPSTSKTHNGVNRYIPIPSFLADEIRSYIYDNNCKEYVFSSKKTEEEPVNAGTALFTIRKYCKAKDKQPFVLHDLRRTYISYLTVSGCPRPIIKAIVGHGLGADVHDLYIRVGPAQTRAAVPLLESWIENP